MSVCTNNTGDYKESILNCTKAIAIDGQAAKAFYLRSVAHQKRQNLDESLADVKTAIRLQPSDAKLRQHYEAVRKEKAAKQKGEKSALAKFFGEGVYNDKADVVPKKVHSKLPTFSMDRKQTFFDINIYDKDDKEKVNESGRVVFEVFDKDVPKTADNFVQLCRGEKGAPLSYKGCSFHRIIDGFMMQGGDTTAGNGTGGMSIYGDKFEDEGVWFPHTHAGILSMANAGPDTNSSQFFICYGATPHLNEKHTIFGRVISGFDICEKAAKVAKGQ